MKTTKILEELEQAAKQLGFVVRKEKGNFRGGICTVEGESIIMLNKRHIPDVQLVVLADSLREAPIDTIYLKPAVREALEDAWDQLDAGESDAAAPGRDADPTPEGAPPEGAPQDADPSSNVDANESSSSEDETTSSTSAESSEEAESEDAESEGASGETIEDDAPATEVPHAG